MLFIIIIFCISASCVLYTYIGYPLLLILLSRLFAKKEYTTFSQSSHQPNISILLAVYNEEKIIANKIQNIFESDYPSNNIQLLIGSDASTDGTNEIIQQLQLKFPQIELHIFQNRTGKPEIINQLKQVATHEILVLTDAKAIFAPNTLSQITNPLTNPKIGLVSAKIINAHTNASGISFQEKTYFSFEAKLKYYESTVFGTMMGAFGVGYAIRKSDYYPTPPKFNVDDFYITMKVLESGKKAILNPQAVCYQNVSNQIDKEFKRKTRISIGNFQNLNVFAKLLFSKHLSLTFCFFSHKILRWFTPFFILLSLITNLFIFQLNLFFTTTLYIQIALFTLPLLDLLLKQINIHFRPFRFITHFYTMNLALLYGCYKFLTGVDSNIWEPTTRAD